MFGPDILVAPILHQGQRERRVWLPAGTTWRELNGEQHEGGQWIGVAAPLDAIPVLVRDGSQVQQELGEYVTR
jgi:alpha-D-xyloside xylohydrolase